MGIDIKPGSSPRSTRQPRYAAVIMRDREVIAQYDDVPLYSVIRLILEYHVDILAVDSISELASSSRDIVKLSKLVPEWCRIVEVTSGDDGSMDTMRLAQLLGAPLPTNPLSTAYLNALAALNGYGRIVKLQADRFYIIVSKGRTPIQGGASTSRFMRGIRASVLQVVREIKERLDQNGVEYDLVVKESEGGLERGFFIVYAPIDRVRSIISAVDVKNVKVRVKPAQPLHTIHEEKRKIIVGIDPGTTIGVAILDLDGRPLFIKSFKTPDREVIINTILSYGRPIVIAVDVSKPPEYVKKISTLLDTVLYTPERDIDVVEKQRIVSEYTERYKVEVEDSHARDALVAALKSYRSIKPLIDEVESKIRGVEGVDRDEVVFQVLRGRALSEVLEDIFRKRLSAGEDRATERDANVLRPVDHMEEVGKLKARITELENKIRRLEEDVRVREELIKNLEVELRALKKPRLEDEYERRLNQLQLELEFTRRSILEKDNIIEALRGRVAELYKIIVETARGRYTVACKASALPICRDTPVYLDNIVYVEEAVRYAKERGTAILVEPGCRALKQDELKIPVVEATSLMDLGDYVLLDSSILDAIRRAWEKIREEELRSRRERLIRMIKEYQEARRRSENIED